MIPVTIVILTRNEEKDLPGCLDSLRPLTDDIYLVDSHSDDLTVEIAKQRDVPVFFNKFTGFGDQRNWAIDNLPHKYEWVLHLDADERPTPAFANEIVHLLACNPSEAGFFVPSKLMLNQSWLRYSGGYPVYQVRLFHRQRLRFINHGHGQREVTSGALGKMREPYLHYAFSKGLEAWFEKHARYAAAEAKQFQQEPQNLFSSLATALTNKGVDRRRAIKKLTYCLPFRGTFRFFHALIVKCGILDGRAGVMYARMLAIYESMIEVFMASQEVHIDHQ